MLTGNSLLERLSPDDPNGADQPAIVDADSGAVRSRAQLLHEVRATARGLRAAGLRPGDRVLFAVRPDALAAVLMMSLREAGGVVVPLDPAMGPALFASRMTQLAPRWVVAESVLLAASRWRWIRRLLARAGVQLPAISNLTGAHYVYVGRRLPGVPGAAHSVSQLRQMGERAGTSPLPAPDDDDEAMIVFTSGTTGAPKAVVHKRRSMMGIFATVEALLNAQRGDVIYAHEMHLILPALFAGATVLVPGRRAFDATRTLRALEAFNVSHYFGVTAHFQQLLDVLHTRKRTLPATLREIWIGAAPVRAPILQKARSLVGPNANVWCVYGMTEILPVARVSLAEKLRYKEAGDLVGQCVPGVRARLSADGELLLSGPNLFAGYLGESACVEHATGDLARLNGDRIVLLGRCKDMIVRGRHNIYPELYEPTIESIDGVRRCAMVGIYDDAAADERVVLAVEPAPGVTAAVLRKRLHDALRSGPQSIDSSALPDVIVVMPLPVAGRSDKIDKRAVRDSVRRERPCASR